MVVLVATSPTWSVRERAARRSTGRRLGAALVSLAISVPVAGKRSGDYEGPEHQDGDNGRYRDL